MKKIYTGLAAFLCIGCFSAAAQNSEQVTAFAKSIEKEKLLDYAGAIRAINEYKDSTAYEVLLRLGWLNYKAGLKKRSLSYYQRAINLMPAAVEPRLGFGFPAYQLEDFADLEIQDKKILELDPNHKSTNANLGLIYYYDKRYKEALPYFQKVVSMYPFDYDNNLMLAWTYLRLGKKAEAEEHFKITLMFSSLDASAHEGLNELGKPYADDDKVVNAFARSYELSGKSDNKGAIEPLKEVYNKDSYFMNLRLGWLSHITGAEKEALDYYKIAMMLKPNAIEPKLGYVLPCEVMGNKNEMKAQYTAILAIDPNNTTVHYKLGMLHYGNKEYALAREHFEKIVKLYPFDYDGLLMLAWTNTQLSKTDEARPLFYKVLCIAPGDASASKGISGKPLEEVKKPEMKSAIRPK